MRFLVKHIRVLLAAERASLREGLRRVTQSVALLIAAAAVLFLALTFGLLGAYFSLARIWPPWQAALGIAGGLALLALVLAILARGRTRRKPCAPDEERKVPPREEAVTEEAQHLGRKLGEAMRQSGTGMSELVIAALVAGIVLGARPRRKKDDKPCDSDDK